MATCTAHRSRTKEPCKARAIEGMKVCWVHGGATPRGIASPHFKNGRHSKYLDGQLLATYQASLQDEGLHELRSELSLVDARINELLDQVQRSPGLPSTRVIREAWVKYQQATRSRNHLELEQAQAEMEAALAAQVAPYELWDKVFDAVNTRRRLADSERKRLVDLRQMLTAEQVMVLLAALTDAVRSHVKDPALLAAVQREFSRIVGSSR